MTPIPQPTGLELIEIQTKDDPPKYKQYVGWVVKEIDDQLIVAQSRVADAAPTARMKPTEEITIPKETISVRIVLNFGQMWNREWEKKEDQPCQ